MNLNPCQKMLLGAAIGDAFGAGYEMQPRWKVLKHFTLSKYSRKNKSKLGKYTDDTQMTIGVVEALLDDKPFTRENLAEWFVRCYKRDRHDGYGSGLRKILPEVDNGNELLAKIGGKSEKNGAAMRAVPFGIFPDLEKVKKYARINAETTHNSPKGVTSSVCIAAASHYFYHQKGEPDGIFDYCINACEKMDKESLEYFSAIKDMNNLKPELLFGKKDLRFGVPVDGMRTAGAVMWILRNHSNSVLQTLIESVLLGGDTDSTASIATGIAAIHGKLKELPKFMLEELENGIYGKKYLIELGSKLYYL